MKNITYLLVLISICSSNWLWGQSSDEPFKPSGFIDLNYYHDSRNHKTLTYNLFGKISPKFQYFSLTNIDSEKGSSDLSNQYAEHNVRWKIHKDKSLDLFTQYVIRRGDANDHIRLGIRWRLNDSKKIAEYFKKTNFKYSIAPMFLQNDLRKEFDFLTIIEHVYRLELLPKLLNKKLSISGFADQNIRYLDNGKIKFIWVSEHQLAYQFYDQFFVVVEYRINDFLPSDNYGIAFGLNYKLVF